MDKKTILIISIVAALVYLAIAVISVVTGEWAALILSLLTGTGMLYVWNSLTGLGRQVSELISQVKDLATVVGKQSDTLGNLVTVLHEQELKVTGLDTAVQDIRDGERVVAEALNSLNDRVKTLEK